MAQKIQVKRGNKANLPTLDVGEFGLCQDTNELFIGNSGNQKIFPPTAPTISDVVDLQSALDGKVDDSQVLTNVPVNAEFTDTVTTINGKTGAIAKADITALGIPAQDTVYTHPTTAGNKHIPTGGTVGQILRNTASGTVTWEDTATDYTTTITTTWSGTGPFTQNATVSGITASDVPFIFPVYSTTNATAILQKEAWNMISGATTSANTITFTCFEEKPVTAIPIQIRVVR